MLGVVGFIVGLGLLIFMSFKRVNAIVSSLVCAAIVGITNGFSLGDIYSNLYMAGASGVFKNYFVLFILTSIYARLLADSGMINSIVYKLFDIFGEKRILFALYVISALLAYSGINVLVAYLVIWPVCLQISKNANKPKWFTIAIATAGFLTCVNNALIGSPQLSNIQAAQTFGTSPYAAPIMSIICSVIEFTLTWLVIRAYDKRNIKKGLGYVDNNNGINLPIYPREECPPVLISSIPVIVMFACFMVFSNGWFGVPKIAALNAITLALLISSILALICGIALKRFKDIRTTTANGAKEALSPLIPFVAMIGFGTVVSGTPTFANFVAWISGIESNPYLQVLIAEQFIGFITASASSTVNLTLAAFATTWMANPAINPAILTRVVSICSSGGIAGTGPHAPGMFSQMEISGESFKDTWIPVLFTTAIPNFIAIIVAIILAFLGIA